MKNKLENIEKTVIAKDDRSNTVNVFLQFWLLLSRAFITEIRNPMDVRLKIM